MCTVHPYVTCAQLRITWVVHTPVVYHTQVPSHSASDHWNEDTTFYSKFHFPVASIYHQPFDGDSRCYHASDFPGVNYPIFLFPYLLLLPS